MMKLILHSNAMATVRSFSELPAPSSDLLWRDRQPQDLQPVKWIIRRITRKIMVHSNRTQIWQNILKVKYWIFLHNDQGKFYAKNPKNWCINKLHSSLKSQTPTNTYLLSIKNKMGNLSSAPAYPRGEDGNYGISEGIWIAFIVCVRIFNIYLI